MSEHRSPQEIEREIERERAGLTSTLGDLQDRFSIDGVVRQVSDHFREHGGDIGASLTRSVKSNPMALALTGIGLAWLIFDTNDRDDRERRSFRGRYRSLGDDYDEDDYDRAFIDRGRRTSYRDHRDETSYARSDRPYAVHRGMSRQLGEDMSSPSWMRAADDPYGYGSPNDGGGAHADKAKKLYDAAGNRVSGMAGSASDTVSNVSGSVSDTASRSAGAVSDAASQAASKARGMGASVSQGAASMRDRAGDAASRAGDRMAVMRARLAEGTEEMTEEARLRVIAARERAIEARDAAMAYTRQGRDRAVDFYDQQPLIAGALALAIGAGIGASMPRTRAEDAYMGEHSDSLFHEAERIYDEEKSKAMKVAQAAMDETRNVANEAADSAAKAKADADRAAPGENVAQSAADQAETAGKRVVDAAKAEADKQGLGKSVS